MEEAIAWVKPLPQPMLGNPVKSVLFFRDGEEFTGTETQARVQAAAEVTAFVRSGGDRI